jgi:hypothetical protein|tara:strand:- start:81 stop:299 length:219 start_codon:yes stop_codon:yes gene_type:complete
VADVTYELTKHGHKAKAGAKLPAPTERKTWSFTIGKTSVILECQFQSAVLIASGDARHRGLTGFVFHGSYKW